ncbi:MAG: hypothetical protein MZV70_61660 [Desulfobacterales bacterium]|nr:hypothetical protein [Desulfobacterales bacterium]
MRFLQAVTDVKRARGEFEDPKGGFDFVEKAYEEYRRGRGMMQPSVEMKGFRKKYGSDLQAELSKLMGWGPVTLSRYENGALQDDVHDKMLRLAMNAENLIRLIEETPDALPEERRMRLLDELQKECELAMTPERLCQGRFLRHDPDEHSGYNRFDIYQALQRNPFIFVRKVISRQRLTQAPFLCRFSPFQALCCINNSGLDTLMLLLDSVPDKYETMLALLIENGSSFYQRSLRVRRILPVRSSWRPKTPDFNLFSQTAKCEILATVRERFKGFSSAEE